LKAWGVGDVGGVADVADLLDFRDSVVPWTSGPVILETQQY